MWRFNPLILRLQKEISLFLLCSHSSWGSSLGLAPPLHVHVGQPLESVLHPDRKRLKEQLFWGLWLTQVREREGYGMQGEPEVAEASMALQEPEACYVFSWVSYPWITGPWQWWGGEVWIVTCACTQDCWWLHSSVSISCPSLVFTLIAMACAHVWRSFRWCSESPLLAHPKTMVS